MTVGSAPCGHTSDAAPLRARNVAASWFAKREAAEAHGVHVEQVDLPVTAMKRPCNRHVTTM